MIGNSVKVILKPGDVSVEINGEKVKGLLSVQAGGACDEIPSVKLEVLADQVEIEAEGPLPLEKTEKKAAIPPPPVPPPIRVIREGFIPTMPTPEKQEA